ncbi:unnamed protein product [Rotaria sordida]|uniref:Uncharacterized protein n=1 Tax=Rotaria sordida TaxID=392033 RepID=A0A819PHL5_9BILA|nr:unnamed protein product [Rotaria sordida]CAF3978648.1 unnamed protein product [Rotaria sordida]CAF4014348.1 unnamed protein product [Rotaria sordida]
MSRIQELNQLESVYIFCKITSLSTKNGRKKYEKIKGVFTEIISICDVLKQDIRQCDANLTSVTILPPSSNLKSNEIDLAFMYSQLLKKILIDIEKEDTEKQKLIEFCREQYSQNNSELEFINEFDRDYLKQSPLWWYSREGFVYKMLNRALRNQDIEIISKMASFVRDVHKQIAQLHEQNTDRQVALEFVQKSQKDSNKTSVLFQMEVDPTNASNPFVSMENISFYPTEKEILFSMNTVFRIGEIQQIGDKLWQVNLSLTNNDDQQLKCVTESIREDLANRRTRWHKLAILMGKMRNFDKADELCQPLFEKLSNDDWTQLTGFIKIQKGDYSNGLSHLQKCLDIWLNKFPDCNQYLPSVYHNIDQTYHDQAQTNNSIGEIYQYMKDFHRARIHYEKALKIQQRSLSPKV